MVTRAEGLDPGVGMTVAAEALGLKAERMQRIPERPVNKLQPRKLTGCEHAAPQPRLIEQLHQRGVRVRMTVRDRESRRHQFPVAEEDIRLGDDGLRQSEWGVRTLWLVLIRVGQTGR